MNLVLRQRCVLALLVLETMMTGLTALADAPIVAPSVSPDIVKKGMKAVLESSASLLETQKSGAEVKKSELQTNESGSKWASPDSSVSLADQKPEEISTRIRDPFARPKIFMESKLPRSELESIPLDQFKVVGVITGPLKKKAMLSANGKTYFVSPNVKIGTKSGFILDIQGDVILVREKIINLLGREENQDIQLKVGPEKPIIGGSGT